MLVVVLNKMGKLSPAAYDELRKRILSWCVIAPVLVLPILFGAFWVIIGAGWLGIMCYREYARATGLFRHFAISATVVVGIVLVTLAVVDHWYNFFLALPALGVVVIAAVGILADRPDGKYDPAADLEMSTRDRFQSTQREVGLVTAILTTLRWSVFRAYLRVFHRLSIEGRENLPRDFPFVLVANHSSHFDALTLGSVLPAALNRLVFPIAAGDTFFETRKAAAFASLFMNALPIWRKRCGGHSLGQLKQRLVGQPCGYIIFPEGTRSRSGEMARFKPGIGMIVAGENVPVVPCYLEGAHEAFPPQAKVPRPRKVRLRIGEALVFDEVSNDRAGWVSVARELEDAVGRLKA